MSGKECLSLPFSVDQLLSEMCRLWGWGGCCAADSIQTHCQQEAATAAAAAISDQLKSRLEVAQQMMAREPQRALSNSVTVLMPQEGIPDIFPSALRPPQQKMVLVCHLYLTCTELLTLK